MPRNHPPAVAEGVPFPAALAKGFFEFAGDIAMAFDRAFAAAGDEVHLLDPCLARLVDCIVDQQAARHRERGLGCSLGRGQEPGAEASDAEHDLADRPLRMVLFD